MPHLAAAAINGWLDQPPNRLGDPLPNSQAPIISTALRVDALGLLYSACVTFTNAIHGISSNYLTWPIVNLYYSGFYAVRCILAANSVAIFYSPDNRKPYSLEVVGGSTPKKLSGNTHKIVWDALAHQFPTSPLLGQIDGVKAHNWMTEQREVANYRTPKFPDPLIPTCLETIDSNGLHRSISAYALDHSMLYAFDPDHAIIAFPLECIRRAKSSITGSGLSLEQTEIDCIAEFLNSSGMKPTFFEDL